jgi:predicted transcriptional regulator
MEEKHFKEIMAAIESIKLLLALNAKQAGAGVEDIAKAMGVSPGRVSQLIATKKYKKQK